MNLSVYKFQKFNHWYIAILFFEISFCIMCIDELFLNHKQIPKLTAILNLSWIFEFSNYIYYYCSSFSVSYSYFKKRWIIKVFIIEFLLSWLAHVRFCDNYFSPIFVSASKLCEPVAAAIFAGFLFGEVPAIPVLVGGVMILGGVLYYSKIEREM